MLTFIVPVYNRPDEVDELLQSLCEQTLREFDVIVVEDGSDVSCRQVCSRYGQRLRLAYYAKENAGPGMARNYGAERASGDWFVVLDSDVVLPPHYVESVVRSLHEMPCDAFGGPDRAHESFTPVQKAISYAMTSFFTTGGIRGSRRGLDRFYPRSFNMGVSRQLWQQLGGFRPMRFGEDIDFSLRMVEAGARTRLYPDAWVWHKRRTDLGKFYRQVRNSGIARINLHILHPGSTKLVHLLPAAFTVGCVLLAAIVLMGALGLACHATPLGIAPCTLIAAGGLPLVAYSVLICADSTLRARSLRVGLLSVPAAFIQLTGYGSGFIHAAWQRLVLRRGGEHFAFTDNRTFYA